MKSQEFFIHGKTYGISYFTVTVTFSEILATWYNEESVK